MLWWGDGIFWRSQGWVSVRFLIGELWKLEESRVEESNRSFKFDGKGLRNS